MAQTVDAAGAGQGAIPVAIVYDLRLDREIIPALFRRLRRWVFVALHMGDRLQVALRAPMTRDEVQRFALRSIAQRSSAVRVEALPAPAAS